MAEAHITDHAARELRAHWFTYLDTVEPLRGPLHAYGLKLTGNLWDAEDLVQETLLRGFAMIGRGDLHGQGSRVANPRAYLFRTASNLWLDSERRRTRERAMPTEPEVEAVDAEAGAVRAAGERLFAAASPQARAAVVLKDVFGFSLAEIADQLRTTMGAVKSALHKGRAALEAGEARSAERPGPPSELVDAFVAAYNAHDMTRLVAVMTEDVSVDVMGVGGGRGRGQTWAEVAVEARATAQRHRLAGEDVVVIQGSEESAHYLEVLRLEGAEGQVSRIIDYCFAADTQRCAAEALGLKLHDQDYHQPPPVLKRMIASTTLPWRET